MARPQIQAETNRTSGGRTAAFSSAALLLAACTLAAPGRNEFEGGGTIDGGTTDGGAPDAPIVPPDAAPACADQPGDPGPGRELVDANGGPLVKAEMRGGIAISSQGIYLGAGKSVLRFNTSFKQTAELRFENEVNAVLLPTGSNFYVSTSAGTYRTPVGVFRDPQLVLEGDTDALTFAVERVFGVQPAASRIVDVEAPATTAIRADVGGRPTLVGDANAVFWATPGNVRRGFVSAAGISEKELLQPGLVAPEITPLLALTDDLLAVLFKQSSGCASLRVLKSRTTTTPISPTLSIDGLAQVGPVVATGGSLYLTSGTQIVTVDLSTGARRVVASRLPNCSSGLAADSTHVYVACQGGRVFQIPR